MKVLCSAVGFDRQGTQRVLEWPEDWPVPQEGNNVELEDMNFIIRRIVWYPEGNSDNPDPFVYIVIGPPKVTFVNH